MRRAKTTIYLEPDLLTATKALAASSGRHEYEIVEDALRAYMRGEEATRSRHELRALLDRVAKDADLDDDAALELAYGELQAMRRGE